MKFLIKKDEIIKCLVGCPTGYASTGYKNDMSYTLYNGDIVIFYKDSDIESDKLYGKIRYDIKKEDYYIDFDIFSPINKREFIKIYFKKLKYKKYELLEDNEIKKIISPNIDKTFLFPIKHMHLIRDYELTAHQYEDSLFILEMYGEDVFNEKILNDYNEGLLDIPLDINLLKNNPNNNTNKKNFYNDKDSLRIKTIFNWLLESSKNIIAIQK